VQMIRVVLADDVPDIRALVRLAIERDGRFEIVGEASNGREAVAQCEEFAPDLVVLDLAMPEMDGLQAIPEVRRHIGPEGRIVVLSGFESEKVGPLAVETCADAYVEKGAKALVEIPDFLARVLAAAPKALAPTT
jgi:DNA-binding NarL/FixJ family response regulator